MANNGANQTTKNCTKPTTIMATNKHTYKSYKPCTASL
jgi:hypothetical protein